jgi:hypothetical protein
MNGNAPGTSARQLAGQRYTYRQMLAIFGFIALASTLLGYVWLPLAIGFPLALAGLWALNHYFLGWMDFVHRREQQVVRGAEAEETVGAILNRLPGDCQVFHDVPAARGNIDHLLFRNDGAIFVIETKSHRGDVTVEHCELQRDHRSFEKDFIHQTLDNAAWVRKSIADHLGFEPRWVHGAIVFTKAHVPLHCQLSHVHILRPGYLERWLAKQPGDSEAAQKIESQIPLLKQIFGGD